MKFILAVLGLALSLNSFATWTLAGNTKGLAIEDAQFKKVPTATEWYDCYGPSGDLEQCLRPTAWKEAVEVTVRYDDSSDSERGEGTYTEVLERDLFSAEEIAKLSKKSLGNRRAAAQEILTLVTKRDRNAPSAQGPYCPFEYDHMCQKPSDFVTDHYMADILYIDIVRK